VKAELLEGEIVVTSPQKWPHYSELDRVADVFRHVLSGVWVRTQAPLDLGLVIEPEPDVSVVKGRREDFTAHPTAALLVVEVSETTLAYDRDDKGSLFAKGNVDDNWVVNLVDCQLEVYRKPVPDASRKHGFGYAELKILKKGDSISLLAFPQILILVDDLLP
jgi:Uma2 family endonuclease